MNYQTFRKPKFRPLPNNSFHSNYIDLRDKSGEEKIFVSVCITRIASRLENPLIFISNETEATRWLLQDK